MLRVALIQLAVGANKAQNVQRAVEFIGTAKAKGASLVVLPECFNSPYGIQYFSQYAEPVPSGETCQQLAKAAKTHQVTVVGGSIPELDTDGKMYNTCPIFGVDGNIIAKFRKVHLFNVNIPGKITFSESACLTPGNDFVTFNLNSSWKVGMGICFDIRFPEMAHYYAEKGCNLLIYPGAFSTATGPDYWELLQRARAVDNQLFVATCSPARDVTANYVAWGHSMAVNPWGKIVGEADEKEGIIFADLDPAEVDNARAAIPTRKQRRQELYYQKS